MTNIDAVIWADDLIVGILEKVGWSNGDKVSRYEQDKNYFFHYDCNKSFITKDFKPIRSRFIVWGFVGNYSTEDSDDGLSETSLSYNVTFYFESPLNKKFVYDTIKSIENEAQAKGCAVTISSLSDYDYERQLRSATLQIVKKVYDEDIS